MNNFTQLRAWDKTLRTTLTAEDRISFDREASGYVLNKGNKLRPLIGETKDLDFLKNVGNFRYQTTTLRKHCIQFDTYDVCHIVSPINIKEGPELHPETYDLLLDYPKLTVEMVALSCSWYNRWVSNSYIGENMTLIYNMTKKNTEDEMFGKALETYEKFHPMQQGGPLILMLILQYIHNDSEQYVEHLQKQVKNLKISKIEGDNVTQFPMPVYTPGEGGPT